MSAGKKVAEMKNKMKNKMKNHWKQICAGLLTAALTGTVLQPQTVYANTEPVTTPEVSAVTGRMEFEEAAVIRVISDGSSGSQANGQIHCAVCANSCGNMIGIATAMTIITAS